MLNILLWDYHFAINSHGICIHFLWLRLVLSLFVLTRYCVTILLQPAITDDVITFCNGPDE